MNYSLLLVSLILSLNIFSQSDIETSDESKIYTSVTGGFMPALHVSKSLHIINGYKINKHWQVGIGFGKEDVSNIEYLPMFLHGQYNLLKKSTTPFVAVLAGYEMPLSGNLNNKGGFTTGLQVGLNHFFSNHVGITTSVGYRYAYFKNILSIYGGWELPYQNTVQIREINRLEFRFGLVFK